MTDGISRAQLAPLLASAIHLLTHTWSISIEGPRPGATPHIYALWHGRMLPALSGLGHLQDLGPLVAMVSDTLDGDLQTEVLARFGIGAVRGSTLGRGPRALIDLARMLKGGHSAVVAVDGPAGPVFCAKSGAVALSAMTGAPIVPVGALAPRLGLILPGTWDKMVLPLPGARIQLRLGKAIDPPSSRGHLTRAEALDDLQRRLAALNGTQPTSLRVTSDKAL